MFTKNLEISVSVNLWLPGLDKKVYAILDYFAG